MMDCKAALAATNGDMDAAVDWLRAKGLAKAAKKSTRVAAEGLVGLSAAGNTGAVVEVNSETDFVARNEKFQAMVAEIAKLAVTAGGNLEKLKTAKFPGSSHAVAEYVAEMVATIGENMTVRRTAALTVKDGVVASYIHNQAAPGMGKIGVLVALESAGKKDELAQFGRMLAMHVAATNPVAMDLSGVPAETLAREKAILEEKNAGKPANQQFPVAGLILSRTAGYENLAKGYASGVDLSLSYQLPTLPIGRISVNTDWSYLIRTYETRVIPGSPTLISERLDVNGTTRWRGVANLNWRKNNWSSGLSAYYVGSFADSGAPTTAALYSSLGEPRYISRQFNDGNYVYRYRVHDVVSFNGYLQRRFGPESHTWLRGSSIRLGVINLADKEPPLVSGAFGYSASVHGSLFQGRTWTMEITRQF